MYLREASVQSCTMYPALRQGAPPLETAFLLQLDTQRQVLYQTLPLGQFWRETGYNSVDALI